MADIVIDRKVQTYAYHFRCRQCGKQGPWVGNSMDAQTEGNHHRCSDSEQKESNEKSTSTDGWGGPGVANDRFASGFFPSR